MVREKMKKLIIFHFAPIEHYPPVQNLLNFLNDSNEVEKVYCFTTKGKLKQLDYQSKKINVYRLGSTYSTKLILWFSYLYFNLYSFFFLLFKRPRKVMYYESLSVFPIFLYKKVFNFKSDLFIHYHEYTSKKEYLNSRPIRRLFHTQEKNIYKNAKWISHTNEVRLKKFLNDEGITFDPKLHFTMPNYPSKKWAIQNNSWNEGQKLKVIYVGYSLTEQGSYLSEIVSFLKSCYLPVELNIYCIQKTDFAKSFEESTELFTLKIHDALPYEELPKVLSQHHIGLILYKAKTPNYIHNAPNKLFEYLSCGLDVWYPKEMKGVHEYDCEEQPKVLRFDFNKLNKYNLIELARPTKSTNNINYFAESVYSNFLKNIN